MSRKAIFPRNTLEESIILAKTIVESNSGHPMRRMTLFDVLSKSPESGTSRSLIISSSCYGLTIGGYSAETLSLGAYGTKILVENVEEAKIDSVLSIEVFSSFFEKYRDSLIPNEKAAFDYLASIGVPSTNVKECFDVIIANGKFVGLIKNISNSERIISREHAIENIAKGENASPKKSSESNSPVMMFDCVEEAERRYNPPDSILSQFPSLNINIEVHLPSDAKPETYDAIFRSIRDNLMKK